MDRRDQVLQLDRVVGLGRQIDPDLELKEAFGLVVEAGQQNRDDREVVLVTLAVESDLNLAVLPRPMRWPRKTATAPDRACSFSTAARAGRPAV